MRRIGVLRGLLLAAAVCALAATASADIKSFNDAVQKGDFRAAAAEAAATWPTLNKERKDLPLIAREFGFAALVAEDFASARMFAAEAMKETGEGVDADDTRALAALLLRAAEFRAAPSDKTRGALMAALKTRDAVAGFDGISFVAVQALVNHDFPSLDYREARESASVGIRIAGAGGPDYRSATMRFEVVHAASTYAITGDKAEVEKLKALAKDAIREIDLATSDEAAQPFVTVYRDARVWADAAENRASRPKSAASPSPPWQPDPALRSTRLLKQGGRRDESCKAKLDVDNFPMLPKFKGDDKYVATLIYVMDLDDAGRPFNIRVAAAMPNLATAEVVLDKFVKRWTMKHTELGATCSLARKDYHLVLSLNQPPRF